jgi:hypothetical protein
VPLGCHRHRTKFPHRSAIVVVTAEIHCMGATNPNGIIGPNTWNALNNQVASGHFC